MRAKSLLLTIALCGAVVSLMAQEQAEAESPAMGIHPYKETANLVWEQTGFSLLFHGGLNVFDGDYPMGRFSNLGYPSVGIDMEYNFNPMWGIGVGYGFAMPQVRYNLDAPFGGRMPDNVSPLDIKKGDLMHKGMMHKGQVFVTFDIMNAWYPRMEKNIFGLKIFAGFGGALYHNEISHHDTGDLNVNGQISDAGKYVLDDDDAKAHKTKDGKDAYEMVGYIPLGASAEFNVSREIGIGARVQLDMFMNDYVDNRFQDKANKKNDAMYNIELLLRWKINAKNKSHMTNVSSIDNLQNKYCESHPELCPGSGELEHVVDTVLIHHIDTLVLVHRDTIVLIGSEGMPAARAKEPAPCDVELRPGWESESTAVVVEGQSLSRLARKYYNNTFCWVYLWLANRGVAPDPNFILPKCVLKVPRLTNDCQKNISKQEAKEMATRYRSGK